MFIPIFLGFGIINAIIADRKGFNPIIWFFAAGFLGLIVVLILPSSKKILDNDQERERLRRNGNMNGLILLGLIGIIILLRLI
jgi:hypothetical protein